MSWESVQDREQKKLKTMKLQSIHKYVNKLHEKYNGKIPEPIRMAIDHELSNRCWHIGQIWDRSCDVDPYRGPDRKYGTPNRRSRTFKLRKAAGFSYP